MGNPEHRTARKKKSPLPMIALGVVLCVAAGVTYLAIQIFSPMQITAPETSAEAAETCRSKITKMLIDETLAFNYKKTKDIHFSELEINSWLHEKLAEERVYHVRAQFANERITFSGLLNPFTKKSSLNRENHFLKKPLQSLSIAFRIVAKPVIRSNRIFLETEEIVFGKLPIPPKIMPDLPDHLELNPFEKQIRTIKETRIHNGDLHVTVYAD